MSKEASSKEDDKPMDDANSDKGGANLTTPSTLTNQAAPTSASGNRNGDADKGLN